MTPPEYTPAPRGDVGRDVAAVALMLAAVAGLLWVGFATDWRLGVLVLSLVAGAAGAALATRLGA